jgi:hypothetical protein
VLLEPGEHVEIVVGVSAHQRAVAEPAHRHLGARPVVKDEVGRVLHADRLLHPVAAADIEPAEAHHAAAADIKVHLDHNDRGALLTRRDRSGQPAGPRADDDDVRFAVPGDGVGGTRRLRWRCGNRAGGRARCQKASPAQRRRTGVMGSL